jgi:hypothetical protein
MLPYSEPAGLGHELCACVMLNPGWPALLATASFLLTSHLL